MTDVQSRPNTADITRHMANVNDDESMVIRSLARQPDTLTAAARSNVGRINGELNSATSLAEQAAALAIDIVHVAGSRIRILQFPVNDKSSSRATSKNPQ